MPLYADVPETDIESFQGQITLLDPYSIPLTNGLVSQNAGYVHGEVSTRLGHSTVVNMPYGPAVSMENWYFVFSSSQVSVALFYTPLGGIYGYQLLFSSFSGALISQTGAAGAIMVTDGQRLYAAFYDSTGRIGYAGGQIYGWDIGADPLFAAPLSAIPAITQPGGGVITAGVHNIAYLTTTRNGYTGILQPVDASTNVFTPVSFTATGGANARFTLTVSLPAYMTGGSIQVVMTTVANPARYYTVPGAVTTASGSTVITFSITDNDLAATGTDVTSQMNLLTSTVGGTPPFFPNAIFSYSSRLGYCTIDSAGFPVVYISDQNNYQSITADQHGIYLESREQVIQGFSLRGVCYLGSTRSFFSTSDNGDVPVTWTPPQKVDGSIGILAPNCVHANPSLGYALIAAPRGFYLFQGGIFPPLPLSYYNDSDWQRINWQHAERVKIIDDQLNRRFLVLAPLDGASSPNYILTWDYTEGDTPETVKYSINSVSGYAFGSGTSIFNINNNKPEVWYTPNTSGYMMRQNDGTETYPYRDVTTAGTAAAISFLYETALVPRNQDNAQTLHHFHGAHWRVRGSGLFNITAYNLDHTNSVVPGASPVVLRSSPGHEVMTRWRFPNQEQQSIQFGTNAIDGHASISLIRVYYTEAAAQRALTAGAANTIQSLAGTPQSTIVSTAFGTDLQVLVYDANGIAVSGVTVTFTAPGSGASGLFGASLTATAVTNSSGIATGPTFTANATRGSYTVTATVPGVGSPANFSLTNNYVVVVLTSGTTWTAPAGVTSIEVECVGGGAAGAGFTGLGNIRGGGGGGGAYARRNAMAVTPLTVYTYSIGAGGVGDSNTTGHPSANGGTTTFTGDASVQCIAVGGTGVSNSNPLLGGAGGLGSSSTGDATFSGGAGANAPSVPYGGGGGGASGGSASVGGAGSLSQGGVAVTGGGPGGNGAAPSTGSASAGATPPSLPGGGGGGAAQNGTTISASVNGGNGANGQITISYP